jgi:putative ABC transport system permease protein
MSAPVSTAFRSLRSSLGTTALVITVAGVAIGGLAALFAVFDGIWLEAVPYRASNRLLVVYGRTPSRSTSPIRYVELEAWRSSAAGSLLHMAAYSQAHNISLRVDEQQFAESARTVEIGFFDVLGESALVGRLFTAADLHPSAATPIVVTERVWRARLHSSASLESQRVWLDGVPVVVIGVVPERIRSVQPSSIFLPLQPPTTGRDIWNLTVLARLRDDTSLKAVQRTLDATAADASVDGRTISRASIISLRQAVLGADVGSMLFLVLAVAALALFIATADIALVVLTAMERKGRAIRVKFALGASRARVVRDLMIEGIVCVALGAGLGLLVAAASLNSLVALMPRSIPRVANIHFGALSIGTALSLSLLVALVTTLVPALYVSRLEARAGIYARGNSSSRSRFTRLLIGVQAVLTVSVMSLAAVLFRSYLILTHVDMGFDPQNLVRIDAVTLSGSYLREAAGLQLEGTAVSSVRAQPDVTAVGVTDQPPLGGSASIYALRTSDAQTTGDEVQCYYRRVSPGYIEAMRIPIIKGRAFTSADVQGAPNVAVLNEAAARALWRGQDPIGKAVYATRGEPIIVVGVVKDLRSEGIDQAIVPEVYRSRLQEPLGGAIIFARTAGSPMRLLAWLKENPRALSPDLKVKSAATLAEMIDDSVSKPRFRTLVVGLFGVLGLILSIAGVAGMTGRAVAMRLREIGTRMAIGASPGSCIRLVLWQSLTPVLAGSVIGAFVTIWISRLLKGFVFGVPEADPMSIAAAAGVSVLAAAVAAYTPARRAARVDPVRVLRNEWDCS